MRSLPLSSILFWARFALRKIPFHPSAEPESFHARSCAIDLSGSLRQRNQRVHRRRP